MHITQLWRKKTVLIMRLVGVTQQRAVVDKIEGANAAALTQAVQKHYARTPEAASKPQGAAAASTSSVPANGAATAAATSEQRIKDLMNAQPVMLFMKVAAVSQ